MKCMYLDIWMKFQVKDLWKPDDSTVIVLVDPSAPNILNFSAGQKVCWECAEACGAELSIAALPSATIPYFKD